VQDISMLSTQQLVEYGYLHIFTIILDLEV
jgi:hypothetical protein